MIETFRSVTIFRIKHLSAGSILMSLLISMIPATPAFAAPAATADSLNAYWKLDETSAGTFVNSSGETNTGTGNGAGGSQNTPQPSVDVPSGMAFSDTRSLNFDGTDDYVTVNNPFTTDDFTIALWVNPAEINTGSYQGFIGRDGGTWSSGRAPSLWVGPATGVLHYTFTDTVPGGHYDYLSNFFTAADEWVHVAWIKSGTTTSVYRNGVLFHTKTVGSTLYKAGTEYNIGRVDNYFGGKLDDVRIYNRALYPGQIVDLASGRNPATYWTGANSTGLENAGNWSGSYLPDPYARIVVTPRAVQPVMTGAIRYAGLVINTGAILKTNGTGITLIESGTFTNYGTLAIKGTETLSGVTNDYNKGTILVYGTGSYSSLPTGNAYYNLTLNDGLVGYWKLDETSGTQTEDSSGWGNSGALIGGATISTTVPSLHFSNPRSLNFDGVNDYVNMGNNNSLDRGSLPFSIAAWFKVDTAGGVGEWRPIIDKGSSDAIQNYGLWTSANPFVNKIDFISGNGDWGDTVSLTTILPDTWYHAAGTWDGTTKRLYVNGVLEKSSTPGSTEKPVSSPSTFKIGGARDSVYLNGNVDDVRVYNRVLKPFEIAVLASGNQPSLGLGTITLNATTTINGTLTLNTGTLDVSTSQYGLIVGKSWLNNGGKFVPRSSTVTFAGTTSGLEILSGGQHFAKLTFNGAGGTWNVRDRLTASGTAVLTAGTLATPDSYNMRFGQFTQAGGAITPYSGIITLTSPVSLTHTFTSTLNTLQIEDPTENGLVGYWKFDEGTNSGAIIDSTRLNPVGVRRGTGAVIWTGSVLPSLNFDNPSAMHFGGAPGDAVFVPVSSSFPNGAGNITQTAWIKTTATDARVIVTRRNQHLGINSDWPTMQVNNGGVALILDDRSYANATDYITVNDGEWHHVAGVKSGTTFSIYVDGTFRDSFTDGRSMDGSAGLNYNIGVAPNWSNTNFIGDIDEVRVYNRALSSGEIMNLANGSYADGDNSTATFTLGGNLDLATMTILSGVVSAGSYTIDVSGDWNNHAGTSGFVAGTSTVDLDGPSTQTVRGSTNFSSFEISPTAAQTVRFSSGTIIGVSTSLILTGVEGGLLTLAPLTTGSGWFIDVGDSATQSVSYVSVSYSDASAGLEILVDGSLSTDGGHNDNWLFVYPELSFEYSSTTLSESAGTVTFVVSRSGATTGELSIPFSIDGSATGTGADFTVLTPSPLRLSSGQTSTGLTILINNDETPESDEHIILTIGASDHAESGLYGSLDITLTSDDLLFFPPDAPLGGSRGGGFNTQKISEAFATRLNTIHTAAPAAEKTVIVAAPETPLITFNDVPTDAWFAKAVEVLARLRIVNGVESATGGRDFLPAKPVTYAELAKMSLLVSLQGSTELPDVLPATLEGFLALAYDRKISVFTDTNLQPDAPATRGDVAQIFMELYTLKEEPIPMPTYADLSDSHPRFFAMRTLVSQGIMTGDSAKAIIRPDAPVNRAEVAVMFGRFLGEIEKQLPVVTVFAPTEVSVAPAAFGGTAPAAVVPANQYRIISKRLHLRADSRVDAGSLRYMWYGGILTVQKILPTGWALVKTYDGKEGYVLMKYIEAVQ